MQAKIKTAPEGADGDLSPCVITKKVHGRLIFRTGLVIMSWYFFKILKSVGMRKSNPL